MSFDTKHSILDENELVAPDGAPTGSNESHSAGAQPAHDEPRELVLLCQTKNTVETVHREAREDIIVNGQYTVEGEDETYFYCYYQRVYRLKVMKDEAKAKINYRDSKGRLLPGTSLVTATKNLNGPSVKTRKKKFTQRSAEQYLEKELLPNLLELLESDKISDQDKMKGALALMNYVKPTLNKVTTEKVIKVVGDDFEDAEVVVETPGDN